MVWFALGHARASHKARAPAGTSLLADGGRGGVHTLVHNSERDISRGRAAPCRRLAGLLLILDTKS